MFIISVEGSVSCRNGKEKKAVKGQEEHSDLTFNEEIHTKINSAA